MPRLAVKESANVIRPIAQADFVVTDYIENVTHRALSYIKAGFPVHLRGNSGTGKTSIAMHIAGKLGRPVMLIHGDEEFSTTDMIGGRHGYRMRKVVDNFVHSVLKTEEDLVQRWVDSRLTIACKHGFTLVYDEYTRSRPEANNVLLSILQERLMGMPESRGEEGYLKVHPNFTALFTSNPEEYAGVFRTQDALRDRMATMDLDYFDRETELLIIQNKSKLDISDAERIINVVRGLRDSGKCEFSPTVRASVMIAKTIHVMQVPVDSCNEMFCQVCTEVLSSSATRTGNSEQLKQVKDVIKELIVNHCTKEGVKP